MLIFRFSYIPTIKAPRKAAYATTVCVQEIHCPGIYATVRMLLSICDEYQTRHTTATTSPSRCLGAIATTNDEKERNKRDCIWPEKERREEDATDCSCSYAAPDFSWADLT